ASARTLAYSHSQELKSRLAPTGREIAGLSYLRKWPTDRHFLRCCFNATLPRRQTFRNPELRDRRSDQKSFAEGNVKREHAISGQSHRQFRGWRTARRHWSDRPQDYCR